MLGVLEGEDTCVCEGVCRGVSVMVPEDCGERDNESVRVAVDERDGDDDAVTD